MTLLVLHTFSIHTTDVTFPFNADFLLTPHTLSSYCRCSPSDTVHHSPHTELLSDCTEDATLHVPHTFFPHTTNATFLTLQIFSSYQTSSDSMTDVALLIWHTLSSHCQTADATLLVVHTFSTRTADVKFQIM